MILNQLSQEDVKVGTQLPWDVFNSDGRLLLRKGYQVKSNTQIHSLLKAGLFRIVQSTSSQKRQLKKWTASEKFSHWSEKIAIIHNEIVAQASQNCTRKLLMFASDIQKTIALNQNALLGALHLYTDGLYTSIGPLKLAIISEIMAKAMKIDADDRQLIIAAALTANLGMREIQDELVCWSLPLRKEQKFIVLKHPEYSVTLLKAAGIDDEMWHRLILEHHEQMDGSGYPRGLLRSDIAEGSLILGLAEIYVGMISERAYRCGMKAKEALRALFMHRGRQVDEYTIQVFIKTIGIYPPGTVVKLANEEVGLVIVRRDNATTPLVKTVFSPRDGYYSKPINRDTKMRQYAIVDMLDKTALSSHRWDDLFGPLR